MTFDISQFAIAKDELIPANKPPVSRELKRRAHNLGTLEVRETGKSATFEATLATGNAVNRHSYFEVLDFSGVNLSRAKPSLPLLHQHDQSALAGHVTDVRVVGSALRGGVHLASTGLGKDLRALVEDGSLRTLSIGYQISDMEFTEDADGLPTYRVTKWDLLEASLVSIPADPNATISRGLYTRDLGLQVEMTVAQRNQLRDAELRKFCREWLFEDAGSGVFALHLTPRFEPPLMRVFAEEIERIRSLERFNPESDFQTLSQYLLEIRAHQDAQSNIYPDAI